MNPAEEELLKEAKLQALKILERSDQTERRLRDKLRQKAYTPAVIDAAVEYVKAYHYLDDARYAESYVRCNQEKKSLAQMRMTLRERGVSDELIGRALEQEWNKDPQELIAELLAKKQYDAESADEKEKRRMYQFLRRRGFRDGEILRAMHWGA